MQVFIKETLYVLDYEDNIVDMIFTSDDHRTPGYAYNITIDESNMGYSNLSFTMPTRIMEMPNDFSDAPASEELIPNPKLELLTPLVKLRYNRQVIYTGQETIQVQVPVGYGDEVGYTEEEYHTGDLIEDYVMDYIVQPLNKKRSGFEISVQYTAIDYPRFNLSKKKMGLTINEDTITRDDWSLYEDEPMDVPGTVQYTQWTQAYTDTYAPGKDIPLVWTPNTGKGYPLDEVEIEKLLNQDKLWTYGLTSTVYWWPIAKTAREEGILYEEGDYLTLHIYPKFETGTVDTSEIRHNLDFYGYEWLYLDKGRSYLTPNNACNYLNWILDATNWTIENTDARYVNTYFNKNDLPAQTKEGNYALVKTLAYDTACIGTVYGVDKLPTNVTEKDGGKWVVVVTYNDDATKIINTQVYSWNGTRWYLNHQDKNLISTEVYCYRNGVWEVVTEEYWTHSIDKKTGVLYDVDPVETEVARPEPGADGQLFDTTELRASLSASDSNCYNTITELCKVFQLYPKFNCEKRTVSLKLFSGKNHGLTYSLGHSVENTGVKEDGDKVITKLYSFGGQDVNGSENINLGDAERVYRDYGRNPDNIEPWDPNAPEYIQKRSPYGTNYVYNFKWMYDNDWMTKDQILGLYDLNQQIQDLNKKFLDPYTKDYLKTHDEYVNAGVTYAANQDEFEACLTSMMNTYYFTPGTDTIKFTAFPEPPADCEKGDDGKYYLKIEYCDKCGAVAVPKFTNGCPTIKDNVPCDGHIHEKSIHIKTWEEEEKRGTTSVKWDPTSKGFYHAVYEQLGEAYKDYIKIGSIFEEKSLTDYETNEKAFIFGTTSEGKENVIYDKSGNLYNWNDYVKKWKEYYGYSLLNEAEVNRLQDRVEMLEEEYRIYQEDLAKLENLIQDNYGDYIIEGKFNDAEIVYPAILLNKTLEASEQFSIPEVTYTLNVIDSSGLIEYRTGTTEIYNELVHTLHNLGQIVPKAGDYVKIYDEPMGLFGVPGVITGIKRSLDNPSSNSITLDTSYTDNDELVGNIITATNTVLSNKDIYTRTAVIKPDGTLDGGAIAKSLEQANGTENVAFVGSKGSTLLDSKGLLVTNPDNPDRKMKYTGTGVYGTVDGGITYEPMLTPNGINANYVSAGSIDTHKVQIISGLNSKVVLDSQGLSIKDVPAQSYAIPDKKYKTVDGVQFLDWSGSNLKAFVGVDYHNQAQLFLSGQMQIEGGSTIAGWNVLDHKLSSIGENGKYVGISSNGDYAFWAGNSDPELANFRVGHDGSFYSKVVSDGDANTLSAANGNAASLIKQTAESISLSVTNGETSAGIKISIKDSEGNTTTKQGTIEMTGLVSFTSLSTPGQTTIDGGNIKTGTVTADQIDATNLKVKAANITGTLTASQINASNLKVAAGNITGTLSVGQLDSSVITTSNFSAQTINADKIKSGTITSAGISLPGIKVATKDSLSFQYYSKTGGLSGTVIVGNPWTSGGTTFTLLDGEYLLTKDGDTNWRGMSGTVPIIVAGITTKTLYFKNGLFVGFVE